MKKYITVVLIILLMATGFFIFKYLETEKTQKSQINQLANQIDKGFDDYIHARHEAILYACTQKIAGYQNIELVPEFYQQAKQYTAEVRLTGELLKDVLPQARTHVSTETAKEMDGALEEIDSAKAPILADTITRGYCRNYETDFSEKIAHNIIRYQTAPARQDDLPAQPNAVYLNSNFQLMNMTADLQPQSLPTTLFIASQAHPIQCHYLEAQAYIQAITTHEPKASAAYKASEYFYQHDSPQINYILACQADTPLSERPRLQFSDTYPWYQPVVAGSPDHKPAAGDALAYMEGRQLVLVFGHEPCVCNRQSVQQCQTVKAVSREYNTRAWKMIAALQAEESNHSPSGQQYIDHYVTYAKNEFQKDFCYINRAGMLEQLNLMLKGMEKSEKSD